jgi:CheY-like chemotaxis protein
MKKLNCILLIDDDDATNYLNKIILNRMDCVNHIQVAKSGKEAINYLVNAAKPDNESSTPSPDLIFLDINMPSMNGWEFLDHYKGIKKENEVLVVMLTTSMNPEDEMLSKEIPEVAGFKHKPFTKEMMQGILEEYFG